MSELLPTRIVDRNGKITTVHKKSVVSSKGRTKLEKVVLLDPETQECERLFAAINKKLTQMGLTFGSNRHPEILGSSNTMPKEQLQQTLRLLDSYLSGQLLVNKIESQHTRLNDERFRQWLSGMDRITGPLTEMNEYGDVARFTRYSLDVVSETIMGVIKLKERNQQARDFTEQQTDDLIMMTLYTCQLSGNGLQAMTYSAVYDDHLEHTTTAVMDLYLRHPESLERVEWIVDSEGITRFAELEDLLDGEHAPALVSGAL